MNSNNTIDYDLCEEVECCCEICKKNDDWKGEEDDDVGYVCKDCIGDRKCKCGKNEDDCDIVFRNGKDGFEMLCVWCLRQYNKKHKECFRCLKKIGDGSYYDDDYDSYICGKCDRRYMNK